MRFQSFDLFWMQRKEAEPPQNLRGRECRDERFNSKQLRRQVGLLLHGKHVGRRSRVSRGRLRLASDSSMGLPPVWILSFPAGRLEDRFARPASGGGCATDLGESVGVF